MITFLIFLYNTPTYLLGFNIFLEHIIDNSILNIKNLCM